MHDYPYEERVLPFILEDKAARLGDKRFLDGEEQRTYREVLDEARRLGGTLERLGLSTGDRVLTMLPNVVEAVSTFLGIAWVGAVGVPVNSSYRGDMLQYIINDADARVMVIHADFLELLLDVEADVPSLERLLVVGEIAGRDTGRFEVHPWTVVAEAPLANRADVEPGDLQAIMYTSGTTGASKGVMVPYHAAYQYANPFGTHFQEPGEVIYVTLPLFHIGGQWQGIYAALLSEGCAVLKSKFSVKDFWAEVDRYGVTQTTLIGVMAEFLWKQPRRDDDAEHSLQRTTIVPVLAEAEEFAERFGVRIGQGWGLTEVGSVTTPPPLDAPPGDPHTCGFVRDDLFDVMLVDEGDREVPLGTNGEALVRPKQPFVTMLGYWRKPEATVETCRNLWVHTGDVLCQREDGSYVFVDRAKDCIRRRGENISSREVELAVIAHPDVRECAAVAVQTDYLEDEVKVAVSLVEGSSLSAAELHTFLEPRMPVFMVPRYIEILPDLPKTETSKIRKEQLKETDPAAGVWDREATTAKPV